MVDFFGILCKLCVFKGFKDSTASSIKDKLHKVNHSNIFRYLIDNISSSTALHNFYNDRLT